MPELLNWDMLRNPYNWVVVVLMISIAVLALTYLQPYLGTTEGA